MPCYSPLQASVTGDGEISFSPRSGDISHSIELPCGQCIGCRLRRSSDWATRCVHEAALHETNSFVTLTYSDATLEGRQNPFTLDRRDVQLFLKRLRKSIAPQKILYLGAGEYGGQTGRPHYHLIIFNYWPPDAVHHSGSLGNLLYSSGTLDALWNLGFTLTGSVTKASANYVASYALKKITGPGTDHAYDFVHPETGKLYPRIKPFLMCSTKPAIGKNWYEKYGDQVHHRDSVIIEGREASVPRYYDKLFSRKTADIDAVKWQRVQDALQKIPSSERTPERRAVSEAVKKAALNSMKKKGL